MSTTDDVVAKPTLRGVLHQVAAPVALVAGVALAAQAPTTRAALAALGFTLSLVLLYAVSATYHRVTWTPSQRAWMRRADHASIFVLIAGTYTPIALLALPDGGLHMLALVWVGALVGVGQTLFWIHAPKAIPAIWAVLTGWSVLPWWAEARAGLTASELTWIFVGGVVYTVGAVFYAVKRPNPVPGVFGYHEMFHLCTIIAAVMHFYVVASIVLRST